MNLSIIILVFSFIAGICITMRNKPSIEVEEVNIEKDVFQMGRDRGGMYPDSYVFRNEEDKPLRVVIKENVVIPYIRNYKMSIVGFPVRRRVLIISQRDYDRMRVIPYNPSDGKVTEESKYYINLNKDRFEFRYLEDIKREVLMYLEKGDCDVPVNIKIENVAKPYMKIKNVAFDKEKDGKPVPYVCLFIRKNDISRLNIVDGGR